MRDLAGERLEVRQEFLGQMMDVQRSTVSLVARTLQRAGLIQYRRGNIEILQVRGLREAACECYATMGAHYQKLRERKQLKPRTPSERLQSGMQQDCCPSLQCRIADISLDSPFIKAQTVLAIRSQCQGIAERA
jgi:Crp-like helix-turn-helix domain